MIKTTALQIHQKSESREPMNSKTALRPE